MARLPRQHRDRGAATSELVLAAPLLMLLLTAIVQFALAEHAHHIAQAAASRALAAARADGADAAAGEQAGRSLLTGTGTGSLRNPSVTVRRTATDTAVQVRAE